MNYIYKLKKKYLGENNNEGKYNDAGEYKEDVLVQIIEDERKGQGKYQARCQIGKSGQRHCWASGILTEALGCVNKRNGTETNGEANHEEHDAHDAQIRHA